MIKVRFNNFHLHTDYSNIFTIDCVIKPKHIINRTLELNHTILSCCEHGYAGNFLEKYQLAQDNNLKFIYGMEVYYVKNRYEKDKTNSHLCVFATNKQGFYEINSRMSEANKTGYYYKPRWDLELLLSLNPQNIFITTACIGNYINKSEDKDYINNFILPLKNHFGNNFMLEIQDNFAKSQIEHNQIIKYLSNKFAIELIHGCDTHYILPEDAKYRDLLLKGKGIKYDDENGFILDYPTYEEIINRYKKQGIFNDHEIQSSIKNTLIFDNFEEIHFDKEIKIPTIYPNEDSNKKLKEIINKKWIIDKKEIPKERFKEYIEGIKTEYEIIEKTNLADYFLINEKIINKAKEKGGVLTYTGRGSAPSFYINKLLGFTEIDRFDTPIPLYPTRFMSISRILESKSLPDIDFNTGGTTEFVEASKEVLGQDNIYLMIAYGTMKDSAAFRNYCRALNLNINDYNEVSKNLEEYKEDPYWGKIIKESEIFLDVIDNIKPSPCSYLLLDKPISEEFGLIKIKDEICCCIDGYWSDYFKYLKNDFLIVTVWEIISDVFKIINKPIPTIRELNKLIDDKIWELYEKGLTATLNQTDTDNATTLIKKYKPKSTADLCAFVAAIRPGFASMLNTFLNREKYSYDIKEFDELLKSSQNFCLYQENVMQTLMYAGFPEDETYGLIKLIAKKRAGIEKIKDRFIEGFINKTGSEENAEKVWQIINDNADYSFNSSHSLSVALDSIYGAYLKVNYPLEYFTVVLNKYVDDIDKTQKITHELSHFNITIQPIKFRKSQAKYSMDKETNSIFKGIESIKFCNSQIADELYQLKDNQYSSFIDLLIDIDKTSCNSRQLEILITLNFFDEFGKNKKLLNIYNLFSKLYGKKQIKKEKVSELDIEESIIKQYSRETAKSYLDVDIVSILKKYENNIINEAISIINQITFEQEYLGYSQTKIPQMNNNVGIVCSINTKYTPVITIYYLKDGNEEKYKIPKKYYKEKELKISNIIVTTKKEKRPKYKMGQSGFEKIEGEYENYIVEYYIASEEKVNDYINQLNAS